MPKKLDSKIFGILNNQKGIAAPLLLVLLLIAIIITLKLIDTPKIFKSGASESRSINLFPVNSIDLDLYGRSFSLVDIGLLPGRYTLNGFFQLPRGEGKVSIDASPNDNPNRVVFYKQASKNEDLFPIHFDISDTQFVRFKFALDTESARFSKLSLVCVIGECSRSSTPIATPSATITSVNKTYLSDGEDVVVNFTTNGIANLVNLRIDKVESFSTTPPTIQVKPSGLTRGSIVWPATHIAHTLGFHEITLHPYYCSSPSSCVAGPISNAVFVEMIGTTPVSDTAIYGNCAAFDRYRYKAGKKTNIYCPGAWKQEAEYSSRCSADNENPYYYEYCREQK